MDDKFFLSIVDKFNSSAIAELDFNDGNTRLILRKESVFKFAAVNSAESKSLVSPNVDMSAAQMPQTQSAHAQTSGSKAVHLGISAHPTEINTNSSTNGEKITSPIVATFYSSPGPDAPPFVKAGTRIKAGQTLCILEAMKMMNHLEAEFDCEVIEVHATSGELVEYGQDIFTVKRI